MISPMQNHAILFLDESGRFIDCNTEAEELFGAERNQLIGATPQQFSPEFQPDGTPSNHKAEDRIKATVKGQPQIFEWRHRRPDQTVFDTEVSLNRIEIGGQTVLLSIHRDITAIRKAEEELRQARENLELRVEERTAELQQTNKLLREEINRRKQTEKNLRRSETKYRHLVESGNTIILEIDTRGRISSFNKYAERFFGFSEAEIVGQKVIGTIVPPHDSSGRDLEEMMRRIMHHPEEYRLNENENIKKNGEKVWIIWTNQPIIDDKGNLREILCVGIDHTQQRLEEMKQAQQAMEQAAAEERNRLARDLHDAVSQTLFSAGIIAEVLPRLWEKDPEEGRKRLEEVRQLTRGALAEMRSLLFELRPSALAEAELSQLLQQLAESASGRGQFPVKTEIKGYCGEPPADVKTVIYRIAQEALNNIIKHSGATKAELQLDCSPDRVSLVISDNGCGFNTEKTASDRFGLSIMRERAADIGAGLNIASKTNKGTKITISWPKSED